MCIHLPAKTNWDLCRSFPEAHVYSCFIHAAGTEEFWWRPVGAFCHPYAGQWFLAEGWRHWMSQHLGHSGPLTLGNQTPAGGGSTYWPPICNCPNADTVLIPQKELRTKQAQYRNSTFRSPSSINEDVQPRFCLEYWCRWAPCCSLTQLIPWLQGNPEHGCVSGLEG